MNVEKLMTTKENGAVAVESEWSVSLHEWFYAHAIQGLFTGASQASVADQALLDRAWDLADRLEAAFRELGLWTPKVTTSHQFFAGKMMAVACYGVHNYGLGQFHDVVRRAFELGSITSATEDRASGGQGLAPAFPASLPSQPQQYQQQHQQQGGMTRAAPIMLARPMAPQAQAQAPAGPVVRPYQAQVTVTPVDAPPPVVGADWLDPGSENVRKVTLFWRHLIPDLPPVIAPGEKGAAGSAKFRNQLIEMYKAEHPEWEREYRAEIGQDPLNFQR